MNVLILSPQPQALTKAIAAAGDDYVVSMSHSSSWPLDIDFIVSFGYRHIIKEPYLTQHKGTMVNIHSSMLPWNRGADPNFWSWFDNTPKGVSIHLIDGGLDTGELIARLEVVEWKADETLATSYEVLQAYAGKLFEEEWKRIRVGDYTPEKRVVAGSYHNARDKDRWMGRLPIGWETPVKEVAALGEANRKASS